MTVPCTTCHTDTDTLALFPGNICLACYEATDPPMWTADQIVAAFGGRRTRRTPRRERARR